MNFILQFKNCELVVLTNDFVKCNKSNKFKRILNFNCFLSIYCVLIICFVAGDKVDNVSNESKEYGFPVHGVRADGKSANDSIKHMQGSNFAISKPLELVAIHQMKIREV